MNTHGARLLAVMAHAQQAKQALDKLAISSLTWTELVQDNLWLLNHLAQQEQRITWLEEGRKYTMPIGDTDGQHDYTQWLAAEPKGGDVK